MSTNSKDSKNPSFEKSLKMLEEILEKIESSNIGLNELVDDYSKAQDLLKICRTHLDNAELKISQIKQDGSLSEFKE